MITITIEEALLYFETERLFGDTFLNTNSNTQLKALKMAENQIKTLKFNNYNDEEKIYNFKRAIYEQAIYLLETKNTQRSKMIEQGVTSFSVEGLSESYSSSSKNRICEDSIEFIRPYLLGSVEIC